MWTGVGNQNQSTTQLNQSQSSWNNWNGVENPQQKGFGTGMAPQPTTYPPAPVYYQSTQPDYRQILQPSYSQVTQPTYSQTFPTMMPGIQMSQPGPGQSLNGSLMGLSLNGTYGLNQVPHSQTQNSGITHTQSQGLAPQVAQQVQNVPQYSQGSQQNQTIAQHSQFQAHFGQTGMGQPTPTTTC